MSPLINLTIMQTFILRDNTLTQNTLYLADANKAFKGGYIAIIQEFTYLHCWGDKRKIKRFRNENKLTQYLNKNYPSFNL